MNYKNKLGYFFHNIKQTGMFSIVISLCLILFSQVFAQSTNARNVIFNKNVPVSINTLPAGKLRSTLKSLPAPAQARALGWLRRFEFPAEDVSYIRADQRGGIFYEDPEVDGVETIANSEATPTLSEITLTDTFTLHSKPGASRSVYLDMDGHIVSGTAWNSSAGVAIFNMRPYDTDGDENSFNSDELNDIAETWKRVSEDFSSFDIDVTTEQPAAFGSNVGHILISPREDQNGNLIYPNSAGGVAYVGVWGRSNYDYYQPALVFPEGTLYSPQSMSEAATHELGHNLGLSHDGTSSVGYYQGHGSDYTSWAPIMGVGYYKNVTQWSKGEYSDANNQQDDLDIIRNYLTYRSDDHEDIDFANATALVKSGSLMTTVTASNPVTDSANISPYNKGIIEDRSDMDLFYFDVGAGDIDLSITPPWIDDFSYDFRRGMNLDIRASLYNESGSLVAQNDPGNDTFARVTVSVSAGRYILAIEGVGVRTPSDGYSDYASIGQYFINGIVPEDITYTASPTAPSDVIASLTEPTNILLSWTDVDSTPENNESAYYVYRQINGGSSELIANLPRDSFSFADNNLANASYVYYLEVFNGAGTNTSNTTSAIDISEPVRTYVSSESTLSGIISSGSYIDTINEGSSEVLSEVHQGGKPSNRVSALEHLWTISGVEPGANINLEVDTEAPANLEGDDFIFSYAVNGGNHTDFLILENGTGRQTLTALLPSDTSMLTLRVVDTDRTKGNANADSIIVHSIAVISGGDPAEQTPVVNISNPVDGLRVDMGTSITFSATASDFEDDDLSVAINWSSDLDGAIGSGGNNIVSTLSIGTHVITASVTDSAGKLGEASIEVSILDPDAVIPTIHIAALTGSSVLARNKWEATITVAAEDNDSNLLSGATITGTWSNGKTGSCVTDASVFCSITLGGLKTSELSVEFTVSSVTHSAGVYDSLDNVRTSIIVNSP